MIDWIALGFLYIGLFFLFVGTLGIYRFKDVYLRLHASSKSLTFGFSFIIFGVGLMVGTPDAIAKSLIAVVFQFVTAPLAAQMIARSALLRGLKPLKMSGQNLTADTVEAPDQDEQDPSPESSK